MKVFKCINKIGEYNELTCVVIANDFKSALKLAQSIAKRRNWGNNNGWDLIEVEMNAGVVSYSFNWE